MGTPIRRPRLGTLSSIGESTTRPSAGSNSILVSRVSQGSQRHWSQATLSHQPSPPSQSSPSLWRRRNIQSAQQQNNVSTSGEISERERQSNRHIKLQSIIKDPLPALRDRARSALLKDLSDRVRQICQASNARASSSKERKQFRKADTSDYL